MLRSDERGQFMPTFASLPPGAQQIITLIADFLHFPVANFPGGPGGDPAPAGGIAPSGGLVHSADVAPNGGLAPSGGPLSDVGGGGNAGDQLAFSPDSLGAAIVDDLTHWRDHLQQPDLHQTPHDTVAPAGFEDILAVLNNAAHWDFM
jgi:hypothetical protein